MKQFLYILAFGLFGLIVSTLIHAAVEMIALDIIFNNPDVYTETFWWQEWAVLHRYVGSVLWITGLVVGLYLGKIWWKPYGSKPGFYHWRK